MPFVAAWAEPKQNHPLQDSLPIQKGGIQQRIGVCYDVFPTLLNLAGAAVPKGHVIDGSDLKQRLAGNSGDIRREVFVSHFPHLHENDYFTTLRRGEWKLIYRYRPDRVRPLRAISSG